MLGVIGLILAVAAVITLIWKNWHMAVVSLIGALIVIVFNMMDPTKALTDNFMKGMSGFAGSWFLLFMLGAIFGKVMGDSGASVSIANDLLKRMGDKYVVLVIMITGLILSYGGIGTFIIAFSIYPIAVALFQKADIPKKLIVATIMVMPVTVCMAMLPGSPSTQNLMPTLYFHTTAYAGAINGIICSIIMAVSAYIYLNYQVKKAKANGEHFIPSPGEEIMDLSKLGAGEGLPLWKCYAPIVVLLIVMFALQKGTKMPSTYAVATAMALSCLVGCWLYNGKLDWKKAICDGSSGGLGALIATSSIMGFGAVVAASAAYKLATGFLVNMNMGPLVTALISINVIAAITGSSAGGLNIFLSSMGEYMMASGLNPELLHRAVCIASSGFDAMPHASGMVVCNQIAKTSQRDTYLYVFMTCAIMPFICAIISAVIGTMGII
jgi:H+/gluconate symporter-like permease